MTDLFLTAAKRGISTIDRTMSRVVLLLWLSTLEREVGLFGNTESPAE